VIEEFIAKWKIKNRKKEKTKKNERNRQGNKKKEWKVEMLISL
jgi:hypothetical protein